jgi:hypothetical protein
LTNNEFKLAVDELWARTKSGELSDRKARFQAIEELTERYFAVNGKQPEGGQLDRLSTLCLYEEITDDDRMKSRNNEYPIMSERQEDRRDSEQVSIKLADEVGVDGRDHRLQTRENRRKLKKFT